jgi:hypothetical protein
MAKVTQDASVIVGVVLDIIRQSGGKLNFNEAALVVLQQHDIIGDVATFDANLASHPGFRTIA